MRGRAVLGGGGEGSIGGRGRAVLGGLTISRTSLTIELFG